jgi:hypothetical protein
MSVRENTKRKVEIESLDRRQTDYQRQLGWWEGDDDQVKKILPERWLDEEGRFDKNRGVSAHFGLGNRSCFGKKLAVSFRKGLII